jgi:hypothetical protein
MPGEVKLVVKIRIERNRGHFTHILSLAYRSPRCACTQAMALHGDDADNLLGRTALQVRKGYDRFSNVTSYEVSVDMIR